MTAAIAALFGVGVLLQPSFLNGPWYWKWPWRDLEFSRVLLTYAISFGILALAVWKSRELKNGAPPLPVLVLFFIAGILLEGAGVLLEPGGLERIRAIVLSPGATSYFTDALRLDGKPGWLATFHRDQDLGLHSSTHPPGPILYYQFFIRLFGASRGALFGGLSLGILPWLGLPYLYQLGEEWGLEIRERVLSCAFYCLLPALTVFLPEFDIVYPVFTLVLVSTWLRTLEGNRMAALAFGATLFLSTTFAYNVLTLGVFFAGYGLHVLVRECRDASSRWRTVLGLEWAFLSFLGWHAALALATGYDAAGSFRHAVEIQSRLSSGYDRPYWPCLFFDFYDFALGGGVLIVPLLFSTGETLLMEFDASRRDLVLGTLGLATLLITGASGLLRAEAARVWIFLQPLALLPAMRALMSMTRTQVGLLLGLQALLLVLLRSTVAFLNP
ncbi:MAG TPA: hypothetical protein VKU80_16620 [Planctomycetota bacterium]|nr:hypothetical protein [Planctomycetota bacterium]